MNTGEVNTGGMNRESDRNKKAGQFKMVWAVLLGLLIAGCAAHDYQGERESPVSASNGDVESSIASAAAGDHRSEKNKARNIYRHPVKTLSFFGLQPDMTVIEISPGGLWYSEVIAPVLKDRGQFIAAGYDPDVPDQPAYRYRQTEAMNKRFAEQASVFGDVKTAKFSPPASTYLGAPNSADMVVTFRNSHGWVRDGVADAVYASFYQVLKSGGVLGIVQHRGDKDTLASGRFSGYLTEAMVIALAERAGFVLDARSEINANPKDTKDYQQGVWSLPPVLRMKDVDRQRFLAIGESDRMTLRFKKP